MKRDPIVCPFCPLNCDDLVVEENSSSTARVAVSHGCPIALAEFAAAFETPVVRLGERSGETFDWSTIAGSLELSECPTVSIEHPTLGESKAIESLVHSQRIRLTRARTADEAAVESVVARDGVVSATLGDAVGHADLVWMIGDPSSQSPRLKEFFEKRSISTMHTDSIGDSELAMLERMAKASSTDETQWLSQIESANYLAVVLGRDPFSGVGGVEGSGVSSAERLLRWITDRNESPTPGRSSETAEGQVSFHRRAVLFRLFSDHSLTHVSRWRRNQVGRSSLAEIQTAPEIQLGSSTTRRRLPVQLQIGGVDPGPELAKSYVAAANPGVHFDDATIRGDGAVTLPLVSFAAPEGRTPRVEILQRILNANASNQHGQSS